MQISIRVIFFFLFTLVFTDILQAQRFKAGLSVGTAITEVNGARARICINKLGIMAGGVVNAVLNEKNSLQMEINYIQKGTIQRPDSNNNGYYKISLDYIEIPLLFRHNIHFNMKGKPVDNFDWEIGASFGRLIRVKEIYDNSALSLAPNYNKTDISITTGLNYNIASNVYLSLRYSNSVVPVLSRNYIPLYLYRYSFNKGNNMVFQFVFKFIFGKREEVSDREN